MQLGCLRADLKAETLLKMRLPACLPASLHAET